MMRPTTRNSLWRKGQEIWILILDPGAMYYITETVATLPDEILTPVLRKSTQLCSYSESYLLPILVAPYYSYSKHQLPSRRNLD